MAEPERIAAPASGRRPLAAFVLAGRAAWLALVLADTGVRLGAAWLATRPASRRAGFGDRLVAIATRQTNKLGPTFIKMAQLLSTRVDVLPPALCAGLAALNDEVPAMSARTARRLADRRLPNGLAGTCREFPATPVASGSIACVYRAVARDGSVVAVKLRRPGVDRQLRADFALVKGVAWLVAKLPAFRTLPVREMMDQMGTAILAQLDFAAEARSLAALAANVGALGGVRVPRVRRDLANDADGVLVMEFLDDLVRRAPADLSESARTTAAGRALDAVYKMLFADGLVHNDLHPGNLYFQRDGSITIVDAGFVTKLSDKAKRSFTRFFYGMALGDESGCADILIESGTVPASFDRDGFRREVGELVRASSGARSAEFNLLAFATTLFDIQRRYALYADPEFVFPILSLLVLEGAVKEFAPATDFQSRAAPYVIAAIADAA